MVDKKIASDEAEEARKNENSSKIKNYRTRFSIKDFASHVCNSFNDNTLFILGK